MGLTHWDGNLTSTNVERVHRNFTFAVAENNNGQHQHLFLEVNFQVWDAK